MHESGMGNMVPGDKNFTKGYVKKDQELVPAQKLGMDWLYGCGEMYTTVGDMKKLDEAIINGKLLSEQSIQAMFSPSAERKYAFSFIYIQIIFIIMVYYLVGTLSIILIKKKELLLFYFQM